MTVRHKEAGQGSSRRLWVVARRRSKVQRFRDAGDAELVQACLAGDESAWGELVERFSRLVYSIPLRHGIPAADADDVFQGVMAILYRRLGTVRDVERLSAWLIRTTHRECYRIGQRRGRDAALDQDVEDVGAPAEEEAERWERQHQVRRALERLGGRCEKLLTALFLDPGPPSYEAIAEQLGMKLGSVGPTRARCFEKLEKILVDMGVGPGEEGPDRAPTAGRAEEIV